MRRRRPLFYKNISTNIVSKFLSAFLVVILLGSIGTFFIIKKVQHIKEERQKTADQEKREDVSITFVEGKRREEMANALELAGICSAKEFLAATLNKEGYLFPDTYRFFPNTPAKEVADKIISNFYIKVGSLKPTGDQMILASIIEREAQNDEERTAIAGVYTNRMRIGMKLEADPTVQYGKDNNAYAKSPVPLTFSFWQPITQADYRSAISPYNTYLNIGLPPGPIANPGRKSILAAQSPAQHSYIYFLHKDGKLLFSETLQEHVRKQ